MVHRRGLGRIRPGALGIWVALFALALVAARPALADDVFAVTGVPVDVTADTAAAAREQALLEGQHKAADILLRRLTLRDDANKLPALSDQQLLEVVKGIEVESEKISTVRYLGVLTVRFKPDEIRALLRGAGLRYAETVSKPVVVVPVYRTNDTAMLWDETNPWRVAWAAHVTKGGLVPFVVPLGDLTDMGAIGAQDAVGGVTAKLGALAQRYGAADSLVVVASMPADHPGVDIAASRYGATLSERTDVLHVEGQAGEATDALLARAVAEVESQVEENWKQENVLRFDHEETLSVSVPLSDLGVWVAVRRKLGDIAFVRNVELTSFSKSEAVVGIHYIGDIDQLKLALVQKDLNLTQDGALWTLSLIQATPNPTQTNPPGPSDSGSANSPASASPGAEPGGVNGTPQAPAAAPAQSSSEGTPPAGGAATGPQ